MLMTMATSIFPAGLGRPRAERRAESVADHCIGNQRSAHPGSDLSWSRSARPSQRASIDECDCAQPSLHSQQSDLSNARFDPRFDGRCRFTGGRSDVKAFAGARCASVEPSTVNAASGEFYREFYRGGFFVVASTSQVTEFTGGKWWAV